MKEASADLHTVPAGLITQTSDTGPDALSEETVCFVFSSPDHGIKHVIFLSVISLFLKVFEYLLHKHIPFVFISYSFKRESQHYS